MNKEFQEYMQKELVELKESGNFNSIRTLESPQEPGLKLKEKKN